MVITAKQKKEVARVGRSHRLRFIILHGSYAKGVPRERSDLDLAYVGGRTHDLDEYLGIFQALEKVFGNSAERELDVKALHHADPLFRYQVVSSGKLLYGDPADYEEFKLYAYRDYGDSYDLRRLQDHLLEKSIAEISRKYD